MYEQRKGKEVRGKAKIVRGGDLTSKPRKGACVALLHKIFESDLLSWGGIQYNKKALEIEIYSITENRGVYSSKQFLNFP